MAKQKSASKRKRIDTGTDKRYVRRDENGQFKESEDVGRSHAQDQKRDAETPAKRGQGDRGDRDQTLRRRTEYRPLTHASTSTGRDAFGRNIDRPRGRAVDLA